MNEAMAEAVNHDTVLDSYRRAQRAAEDLVAGVRPEQLGHPTPCSEWTVRDLLDHLVYVDVLYAAHIDRGERPEPGDRIGTDPVHGWDLATATGQHTDIEPDVAEESLSVWRAWIGGMPRGGEGFGPEQPVADDAPAADRLAAYLGRKVTA